MDLLSSPGSALVVATRRSAHGERVRESERRALLSDPLTPTSPARPVKHISRAAAAAAAAAAVVVAAAVVMDRHILAGRRVLT